MAQINTGKVIAGGLAAGVVANVIDFLVNGVWLADRWKTQTAKLNPNLDMMSTNALAYYVGFDFVIGILLVWLYAAIRPRFGPGPRTAMIAAIPVWLLFTGVNVSFAVTTMYTWKLMGVASVAGLVSLLLASYVGAMIYKEE